MPGMVVTEGVGTNGNSKRSIKYIADKRHGRKTKPEKKR